MTTFSTEELAHEIGRAVSLVTKEHERVVITQGGQELLALVSLEDLEILRKLEDIADIRAVLEAKAEDPNPTSFEDFCKELGI